MVMKVCLGDSEGEKECTFFVSGFRCLSLVCGYYFGWLGRWTVDEEIYENGDKIIVVRLCG